MSWDASPERLGMGQRSIAVPGHGAGEGQFFRPVVTEDLFDVPGYRRLRAARKQRFGQPLHKFVVEGAGMFHAADFFRFLDQPERLDHAVRALHSEVSGELFVFRETDVPGLETYGSGNMLLEQPVYLFHGVAAIYEDAVFVPKPSCRVQIAGVRAQPVWPVRGDNEAARAFIYLDVMQLETAEIIAVRIQRDDQGAQTGLVYKGAEFVPAGFKLMFVNGLPAEVTGCMR